MAGLTVLIGAWLRVRPQVAGRPRMALAVLGWWTVPLVLAPPLFKAPAAPAPCFLAPMWAARIGGTPAIVHNGL